MKENHKMIKLQNGNSVECYPHKQRDTWIHADNCSTEYKETKKGSGVYIAIN